MSSIDLCLLSVLRSESLFLSTCFPSHSCFDVSLVGIFVAYAIIGFLFSLCYYLIDTIFKRLIAFTIEYEICMYIRDDRT